MVVGKYRSKTQTKNDKPLHVDSSWRSANDSGVCQICTCNNFCR